MDGKQWLNYNSRRETYFISPKQMSGHPGAPGRLGPPGIPGQKGERGRLSFPEMPGKQGQKGRFCEFMQKKFAYLQTHKIFPRYEITLTVSGTVT